MKVTRDLRKAINAAVRANVGGGAPLAEVGFREVNDKAVNNALLWDDEVDLWDMRRMADVKVIADDPKYPGCAVLDLYVTTGYGNDRELETNVYVAIKDGKVVDSDSVGGNTFVDKLRVLGFPLGAGWLGSGYPIKHTPADDGER